MVHAGRAVLHYLVRARLSPQMVDLAAALAHSTLGAALASPVETRHSFLGAVHLFLSLVLYLLVVLQALVAESTSHHSPFAPTSSFAGPLPGKHIVSQAGGKSGPMNRKVYPVSLFLRAAGIVTSKCNQV